VTSFDEFMTLPGCTSGSHSTEKVARLAPVSTSSTASSATAAPTIVKDGVETYGSVTPQRIATPVPPPTPVPEEKKPEPLEQDDPSIPVEKGTKCRRKGCNAEYVSEEVSRGEGEEAKCVFHPGYTRFSLKLTLDLRSFTKGARAILVASGVFSNLTSISRFAQC
jgi:hypothetical protein